MSLARVFLDPFGVPAHHVAAGQRRALAVVLAVHGFAHLVGTTVAVGAISDDTAVDYWFGRVALDDPEVLAPVAILWAVAALGFFALALLTWRNNALWRTDLAAVTVGSAVLCAVALPTAAIGLAVDVALLALLMTEDRVAQYHPLRQYHPFRHLDDR